MLHEYPRNQMSFSAQPIGRADISVDSGLLDVILRAPADMSGSVEIQRDDGTVSGV